MEKRIFTAKVSPYFSKKEEKMQRPLIVVMLLSGILGGAIGCFAALWINLLTSSQLSLINTSLISVIPGLWMGGVIRSLKEE